MVAVSRQRRLRGFTLIELMVVIIVIALMAGMLVPNLGGSMGGVRVEGAARQLAALMDYCYQAATSSGRVHALVFDPEARLYSVVAEPKSDPALPEPEQEARLEPVGLPGAMDRQLRDGIRLKSLRMFEQDLVPGDDGSLRLMFFPDGTTEFAELELTSEQGQRRIVKLDGMTGAAQVIDPQAQADSSGGQTQEDEDDAQGGAAGEGAQGGTQGAGGA